MKILFPLYVDVNWSRERPIIRKFLVLNLAFQVKNQIPMANYRVNISLQGTSFPVIFVIKDDSSLKEESYACFMDTPWSEVETFLKRGWRFLNICGIFSLQRLAYEKERILRPALYYSFVFGI